MEFELIAIVGIVLVVAATALAPKLGVASPLLLVALGLGISLLPFVDAVVVPPALILAGVLPPLLYAAAVNVPVLEFRRDLGLISVFSIVLVLITALLVGLVFIALVPGAPFGIGVALGAVVSPTDAIATGIIRRAGVSPRIVTVLEGEAMLNDASALVLLRAAVASIGVGVSVLAVTAQFAWAVGLAVLIGFVIGKLNLWVRSRITDVSASVALSLVGPFIAYLPAEWLGASGLVAAVVAGLVTGFDAPKRLGAQVRISERAVWSTIALLLESAVFLLVGLELPAIVTDLIRTGSPTHPAIIAIVVGAVVVAVRAALVSWSLWSLSRRRQRIEGPTREKLAELQSTLDSGEVPHLGKPGRKSLMARMRGGDDSPEALRERWQHGIEQRQADLDYLAAEHLGWREGVGIVWAGMRGAVTIAAAQTLPADAPYRSLVILVAVLVAAGTLLIQGLSLEPLARRLGLTDGNSDADPAQWDALQAELNAAAFSDLVAQAADPRAIEMAERLQQRLEKARDARDGRFDGAQFTRLRLKVIQAQRNKLLELQHTGTYPSALMDDALAQLDAEQIGIELRQQYS